MHFRDFALPVLALSSHVAAQGINSAMVFSKQPRLMRTATNARTSTTNSEAVVSAILSQLDLLKPTVTSSISSVKVTLTHTTTLATPGKSTTKKSSTKKSSTKKQSTKTTSIKKTSNKKSTTRSSKRSSSKTVSTSKHTSSANLSNQLRARQAQSCQANVIQYGYTPSPNTPAGFLLDTVMSGLSQAAGFYAPGYSIAFSNQLASANSPNYITYIQLPSYNVSACAAACNAISSCTSFNIYFERSPVVSPGQNCTNPNAASIVKCAMWSSSINSTMAVNIGEWRSGFEVVIQGSLGQVKVTPPLPVSNYANPVALGGAIDTTGYLINGTTPFAGSSYFPGQNYSAQLCANACVQQSVANQVAAQLANQTTFIPCNYFNALALTLNGVPQGTYCQFYSADVSSRAGLYNTTMSGVLYTLETSYGFAAQTSIKGVVVAGPTAGGVGSAISCPASNNQTYQPSGTSDLYRISCFTDYYGNDLSSVGNVNFQQCLQTCATTTGCVGVSMLGTACYMKQAIGNGLFNNQVWGAVLINGSAPIVTTSTTTATSTSTVVPTPSGIYSGSAVDCPAYNNTYWVSSEGLTYSITCGFDYSGSTLASNNTASLSACIENCAANPSCVTADYLGTGCYLKSQVGTSWNTNSALKAARLVNGTNFSLLSPPGASTTASSTTQATATTTTTTLSLSAFPPGSTSTGAVSCPANNATYYSSTNTTKSFYLECGTDAGGGNINVAQYSTWQGCIEGCANTTSCVATTYVSPNCYMKNQYFTTTNSSAVQYAVLSQ